MPLILKATLLWNEINSTTLKSCFIIHSKASTESLPWPAMMLSTGNTAVSKSHGDMDNQTCIYN